MLDGMPQYHRIAPVTTAHRHVNGIVVTVNGTQVKELAGPGQPNWTYQATLNAIVFNPNTDPPKVGAQITVQYPIGCK